MIYKCKMCGGCLDVTGKEKTLTCSFCGTVQTVPNVDEEKILQLYNRATYLLSVNEYDKASVIYEKIIADQQEQAEAYWGLCLCKYGVEYVNDPKTGKKIPTCHRILIESILKDDDYKKVLELADSISKELYKKEAKYIDDVQKKILKISNSEDPYDIFICYKETDEKGNRTIDSVIAENIYNELISKNFRVFFSRVSLEDKIGLEYEPFIFSALCSAKLMLVIGTKKSYFLSPWMKNEWSRFLSMMKNDKNKFLIPCYKDISPYDMPEQFINLQSQDLGKIGFIQDLLKGINKLIDNESMSQKNNYSNASSDEKHVLYTELRRMLLFINNSSKFDNELFEEKLNVLYTLEDPNEDSDVDKSPLACAVNFLYCNKLPNYETGIIKKALDNMWYLENQNFDNLQKTEPFLYDEITKFLDNYSKNRDFLEKLDKYNEALKMKKNAKNPDDYFKLSCLFEEIGDFKDALRQAEFYKNKANSILDKSLTEYIYENLKKRISKFNTNKEKEEIVNGFKEIIDYKDSKKYILSASLESIDELKSKLKKCENEKKNLIDSNFEILRLNENINSLNKELNSEINKVENLFESKKNSLENNISNIKNEITITKQNLEKCSFFSVKRKKTLREKLIYLESEFVKTRNGNNKQLQIYETEFNNNKKNITTYYKGKIELLTREVEQMISSDSKISYLTNKIIHLEKEIDNLINKNEKLENYWNNENISIFKDYYGFDILCIKFGKYPQTKVTIPSLINQLKKSPKNNNLINLHGLEFYASNDEFFLVEPIQWKFINHAEIDGKNYYLLSTKNILDIKSPMNKNNVIIEKNRFLTKDGNPISIYKFSDIRKWLIGDFYKFAFNENEDKLICSTVLDNSAESASDETTIYFSDDLNDKIFLLSYRAAVKLHIGDNFENDVINKTLEEYLKYYIYSENAQVDSILDSLNTSRNSILVHDYEIPQYSIYEDVSELCCFDIYSEYSFEKTKSINYEKGCLLRSADTEGETGYNICVIGETKTFGGQFKNANFDIMNDICPCIIVCFEYSYKPIKSNDSFDF